MQETHLSPLKSYVLGFLLSLTLTLAAFFLVYKNLLTGYTLVLVIMGLAFIQLWVQLIFFLHLGQEEKPRWNLQALMGAGGVIFLVIVGSLWIMQNLEYHMPQDIDLHIMEDERIQR